MKTSVGIGISPIYIPDAGINIDTNIVGYDTFTKANGAPGNTEAVGPSGQAILPRAWVTTTGTITSNELGMVPTVGSELLTNGTFTAWTGDNPNGWTVVNEAGSDPEVSEVGAGEGHGGTGTGMANFFQTAAASLRAEQSALTLDRWYKSEIVINTVLGGALDVRISPAGAGRVVYTTTGAKVQTARSFGFTNDIFYLRANAASTNITVDSASVKQITLSSCIAAVTDGLTRNVNMQVKITCTANTQAGWMLGLDSQTTPANYLHVYCNRIGNKIYVDSVTAGVVTNITSVAFVYSAGAVLECNHDGTTLTVDYNGVNLITSATAMPGTGTLHGVFATDSASRFDNFLVQKV